MNADILFWFQSMRLPWLSGLVLTFTYTIYLACAIPFVLLCFPRYRKKAAFLCICIAAVFLLGNGIKILVQEPRPYMELAGLVRVGPVPGGSSFPSMHTALAFTLFFGWFYAFRSYWPWVLLYSTLIALSRLYLGVHYPTDLLAGVLLAFVTCFSVRFCWRKIYDSQI